MTVNLKRYGLVYFGAVVAIVVLSFGIQFFSSISLPPLLTVMLPALCAAMFEGQKAADEDVPQLTGSEAWTQARRMTGVAMGITLIPVALLLFDEQTRVLFSAAPGLTLVLALFLLGFTLWANRFGLLQGYKARKKAKEKAGGS